MRGAHPVAEAERRGREAGQETLSGSAPRFQDHFSAHAAQYAEARPTYPAALFDFLASLAPGRRQAWDCGTGNGQAAQGLARHFARVLATDASAEQLAHAAPHRSVTYRRAREHESGLAEGSTDLVSAAQAFHWFDAGAFFGEVRRVLRPGGVLAIWCYGLAEVDAACDAVLRHFYHDEVGEDWPPGRSLVDAGYRDVELPFPEVAAPQFSMEASLDLAALGRYVATWSAIHRHRARTGGDPVPALLEALAPHWGGSAARRTARWRIALRAVQVPYDFRFASSP